MTKRTSSDAFYVDRSEIVDISEPPKQLSITKNIKRDPAGDDEFHLLLQNKRIQLEQKYKQLKEQYANSDQ